jgi:hypothetical protein
MLPEDIKKRLSKNARGKKLLQRNKEDKRILNDKYPVQADCAQADSN